MPEHMTRAEHLQWAKERALAYLAPPQVASKESNGRDGGIITVTTDGQRHQAWPPPVRGKQLADACASILSDLRKHPEIDPSAADMVFAMEAWTGGMNTVEKVRHFIEGIN